MYCKGEITLYSWDYKVLVRGNYERKKEVMMLVERWTERYSSQAHHFIIRPFLQEEDAKIKHKRGPYKKKTVYIEKFRDPIFIPDEKPKIIRPAANYNNNKSPYGIADELHKNKT